MCFLQVSLSSVCPSFFFPWFLPSFLLPPFSLLPTQILFSYFLFLFLFSLLLIVIFLFLFPPTVFQFLLLPIFAFLPPPIFSIPQFFVFPFFFSRILSPSVSSLFPSFPLPSFFQFLSLQTFPCNLIWSSLSCPFLLSPLYSPILSSHSVASSSSPPPLRQTLKPSSCTHTPARWSRGAISWFLEQS